MKLRISTCLGFLAFSCMSMVTDVMAEDEYITEHSWLSRCSSEGVSTSGTNFEKTYIDCGDSGFAGDSRAFGLTPTINRNGGTVNERWAKITSDEKNPQNRVLEFGIKYSNDSQGKGRVQLGVNVEGYKVLKFQVKMYLSNDHNLLKTYPKAFKWLDLATVFNENTWGTEYPFVMTTRIVKPNEGNSELYFAVRARTYNTETGRPNGTFWNYIASDYPVPFGEWLLMEHEMVEGDNDTGRYILHMTRQNGERIKLLDISDYTRHPDKKTSSPFLNVTPLKYYMGTAIINHVRNNGGVLRVQWDDLVMTGCQARGENCQPLFDSVDHAAANTSPPAAPRNLSVK